MDYYKNVRKAIIFIEENLKEDIYIDDMAKEIFYSKFHFCRIFFELTGETPGAYLRKRRLTEAANDILSGKDIIEAAFDYRFNSQEAFSRSFKEYFSVTPGLYKLYGNNNNGLLRPILDNNSILIKQGEIFTMNKKPEIKELPEIKITGFPYYGIPDRIPEMWQKFRMMYADIYKKELKEKTYAFIFNCHREISYMISIETETLDKDIPLEFTGKIIPAATWAMFEVTGEDIDDTMAYAQNEWFQKSGYEYSLPSCEMEIRMPNFKFDSKEIFYYCYPVRKRKS